MSVLGRLHSGEGGYTLIELLIVMLIMGLVIGALTTLFVGAANAEIDMNQRFQAQQNARLALSRLRRETHCATSITPAGPATEITLGLPSQCRIAQGVVTWCALSVDGSTTRYRLYRSTDETCGSGDDRIYADYLTSPDVFEHAVQSSASLGSLRVTIPVHLQPGGPGGYTLEDTLVMRNTTRTCISGSPSPPC